MKIKFNPFWVFTIALIFFLIISQLIQDGMFTDGLLYVAVSHNLSQGYGTFLEPHFSKTAMIIFREQPPLYFGILSVFYKYLGSSMYVERFFSFILLLIELFIISRLWQSISIEKKFRSLSWLPVLFFIIIPVVFWSYANLVEEILMIVFVSASVLFSRWAINQKSTGNQVFWVLFSSLAIVLSTFTKGIQGAFPLVAIVIFGFFERQLPLKKIIVMNLMLIGFFFGLYWVLFLVDENILINLELYLQNRLVKTFVTQVHATTDSHFYLLYRLFSELIPVIIIMILLMCLVYKKKGFSAYVNPYNSTTIGFFLIALSGCLPLMITTEQRGFYLLTSMPFFVISFALMVLPPLFLIFNQWKENSYSFIIWKRLSIILLLVGIVFTGFQMNKFKRDKEMLHDIYLFLPLIPKGETIGLSDDLAQNWSLQNYLVRYKYISSNYIKPEQKFIIVTKNGFTNQVPKNYQLKPFQTKLLDLYFIK
jgi:hypothetical protein